MKFTLILFAIFAIVAADVSELPSSDYLPPVSADPALADPASIVPDQPSSDYIPPEAAAPVEDAAPGHVLADDGYRYKTVRRIKYRHRV